MKFVYFGSSNFSWVILEDIYAKGIIPSLIVSRPDQPKGRGLKVLPTEVSLFAQKRNIPLIKPINLNDSEVKNQLRNLRADLFVVADYGKIVPEELLSFPKKFVLGLHPSLLPRYRGAAPIDWALINGETKTAVTAFKVNEDFDHGEIVLQKEVPIDANDDIFSLTKKLAHQGAQTLLEALERIDKGNYSLISQDESLVSSAPKLNKEDGRIIWNKSAEEIRNLIRATLGWPSAYTYYEKKLIKILEAEVVDTPVAMPPATIIKIDHEGIYVATSKGALKIRKLKPQGKKEMDAFSFVCGYRLKENDHFE